MKLTVAVPNQGWFHKFVLERLIEFMVDHHGHELRFDFRSEKPVDQCRNTIIRSFLKTDNDALLFMDTDNPPMRNVLEVADFVLEPGHDILAFPTPIWYSNITRAGTGAVPIVWNCYRFDEHAGGWRENMLRSGLVEVDAAGTGCVLIHRRVLERISVFERRYREDGEIAIGSDLLFCHKAKELGFRIWAHYDYACHHVKDCDLAEVYQVLRWRDVSHAERPNINTPEYWDKEWARREERQLELYDKVIEYVRELTVRVPWARVLDYGCGRGDLLARLAEIPWVHASGCDHSAKAVELCRARGLDAVLVESSGMPTQSTQAGGPKKPLGEETYFASTAKTCTWDLIVSTEVLEHVDDDQELLRRFFDLAPRVLYSVPDDCLPPGLEPEHRRVYTLSRIEKITPHLRDITQIGHYLLVRAEKDLSPEGKNQ